MFGDISKSPMLSVGSVEQNLMEGNVRSSWLPIWECLKVEGTVTLRCSPAGLNCFLPVFPGERTLLWALSPLGNLSLESNMGVGSSVRSVGAKALGEGARMSRWRNRGPLRGKPGLCFSLVFLTSVKFESLGLFLRDNWITKSWSSGK